MNTELHNRIKNMTTLHDDALDALESAVALSPNVTYSCGTVERRHSVRALQHF